MTTTRPTRRKFLRSVSGGVTMSAVGWSSLIHGNSPANQLRIGVIGTGVRGKYLIGNLPPVACVVAICDCAEWRMAQTRNPKPEFAEVLDDFQNTDAKSCRQYQDYREMLDREKLDAVIIATPDHHHSLVALLAPGCRTRCLPRKTNDGHDS